MKKLVPVIIVVLILFPLGILFYKANVLNLSLMPHMIDDVWEFHLSIRPKSEVTSFSFPIPQNGNGVRITEERLRQKGFEVFIDTASDSSLVTWISPNPVRQSVTYSARIDLNPVVVKKITEDRTESYPKSLKKYLRISELAPEDEESVKSLEAAILEGSEDRTSAVRKIYYYVEEEIQRNIKVKTLNDALAQGKGSPLIKARLFNLMVRRRGTPSRIVVMVRLPDHRMSEEDKAGPIRFTFANEVYLNNKWIPVDTNRGFFGERPDNFLVIHRNFDEIEKMISRKNVSYKIVAERALIDKYNKAEFKKLIKAKDSWVTNWSLYNLSLPLQAMFSTILLIPLGTLVLSIARNIIGIPTLGIFSPILLTLFFRETSLTFGIVFFLVIILFGILERYVLDKFYLLAVPRLSVILTLVILMMIAYSLNSSDLSFLSQKHLAFFPIIIVTTVIERLSIMIAEEGVGNTLKTLVGTLAIAILGYGLYTISSLEVFVFTNPEILILIMGILILLGKYKGYRLSEFLRFRDLVKQKKKLEQTP